MLSLPGRAGLGVALAMSYNSKVWINHASSNAIAFNPDRGFPGPGWRLGFGAIQAKTNTGGSYFNTFTGKQSFIFIAPDGTRHDLAYKSSTGYYESYDSTYIRFHLGSRVLQMPNGMRIHFQVDSMNNSTNQFLPNYIIDRMGLPQRVSVHDGAFTLIHQVRNNYDETGTFADSNNQTSSYFIDAK